MTFLNLTLRSLKLFLRDRMAVLFSILTMLIVILLMVFFLGDMYSENLNSFLELIPGWDPVIGPKNTELFIFLWTGAGILCVNGITVTLACYSTMIDDRKSGRLNTIYTSPVNRGIIAVSYIAYAWIASVGICILTLAVLEGIAIGRGMTPFSFATHMKLLGLIAANSFLYSSIMYVLALLFKSTGAWSGIGTVVGTLVGFLGGIYIPLGNLAEPIQKILKCFPVIYGTTAFRSVMTESLIDGLFRDAPEEMENGYREVMGITLKVFDHTVTIPESILLFLALAAVSVLLATILNNARQNSDR